MIGQPLFLDLLHNVRLPTLAVHHRVRHRYPELVPRRHRNLCLRRRQFTLLACQFHTASNANQFRHLVLQVGGPLVPLGHTVQRSLHKPRQFWFFREPAQQFGHGRRTIFVIRTPPSKIPVCSLPQYVVHGHTNSRHLRQRFQRRLRVHLPTALHDALRRIQPGQRTGTQQPPLTTHPLNVCRHALHRDRRDHPCVRLPRQRIHPLTRVDVHPAIQRWRDRRPFHRELKVRQQRLRKRRLRLRDHRPRRPRLDRLVVPQRHTVRSRHGLQPVKVAVGDQYPLQRVEPFLRRQTPNVLTQIHRRDCYGAHHIRFQRTHIHRVALQRLDNTGNDQRLRPQLGGSHHRPQQFHLVLRRTHPRVRQRQFVLIDVGVQRSLQSRAVPSPWFDDTGRQTVRVAHDDNLVLLVGTRSRIRVREDTRPGHTQPCDVLTATKPVGSLKLRCRGRQRVRRQPDRSCQPTGSGERLFRRPPHQEHNVVLTQPLVRQRLLRQRVGGQGHHAGQHQFGLRVVQRIVVRRGSTDPPVVPLREALYAGAEHFGDDERLHRREVRLRRVGPRTVLCVQQDGDKLVTELVGPDLVPVRLQRCRTDHAVVGVLGDAKPGHLVGTFPQQLVQVVAAVRQDCFGVRHSGWRIPRRNLLFKNSNAPLQFGNKPVPVLHLTNRLQHRQQVVVR